MGDIHVDAAAAQEPEDLLNAPTGETGESEILFQPVPCMLPDRIGQYAVKRQLGTGGMGTVYLAVQDRPRRTVALKVMKHGVSSPTAIRRFEHEAHILGQLRHPYIAEVYEAGTHDSGSGEVPYFAMQYIQNPKPITTYARVNELSMRERLELFTKVCEAVAHGHRKGVIHRDLKPSNIMVDASGLPKIIDFGVARATDSDMAVTLQTAVGELIGTPQYMSPEQYDADPGDLDTRSDVYALGVVLYELICGRLPYNLKRMRMLDAARVVRETLPPRPGTINRSLPADVETIALKALDKNRSQRYASAAEFGEDVGRYLRGEPIRARRPSLVYRLRLWVGRHRTEVTVGVFILIVAIVAVFAGDHSEFIAIGIGFVGGIWGYWRAKRAEVRANRQRDEAVLARQEAEAQRNHAVHTERQAEQQRLGAEMARGRAETEARKAVAINRFLLQDLIGAAHRTGSDGSPLTVLDVLEQASEHVEKAFPDQPLVEAALRETIGDVLRSLGRLEDAESHLRRALEMRRKACPDVHADVATSLNSLARLLADQGRVDDAEPLFREAVQLRRIVHGDEHPLVAGVLMNLVSLLMSESRFEEAADVCDEALAISRRAYGEAHPLVAACLVRFGRLYEAAGNGEAALRRLQEALEIQRSALGDDHLHVGVTLNYLASAQERCGDAPGAAESLSGAIAIYRKHLGESHPSLFAALSAQVRLLASLGRYHDAEWVFRDLIRIAELDPTNPPSTLARIRARFGETLLKLDLFDEAEQELRAALAVFQDSDPARRDRVLAKLAELERAR